MIHEALDPMNDSYRAPLLYRDELQGSHESVKRGIAILMNEISRRWQP
jgi:hypothetical protein